MAFLIFNKNCDNINGTLYRIAENSNDLENLKINNSLYKIFEIDQNIFQDVKLINKVVIKYNANEVVYENANENFLNEQRLKDYIIRLKTTIKIFLNNQPNHPLNTQWNNYYNQINDLNTAGITYPLNKSLEQHFNDIGQPSFNILQLP